MAEKLVTRGCDLDATNNLKFNKPKVNSVGGKNVGIVNVETCKSLYIQTPLMLTWGVNENDYDGTGRKTYDLALQFPRDQDANNTEEVGKLLQNLVEMEERIKETAIENSKEWFNKSKMTADVVDALWSPMLRYPKDQVTGEADTSRAPSLRVKIPYYDEKFKLELFDTDRERIFPDENNENVLPQHLIEKGQNIAVVIQSGGIWFANGKFGTTWRLVQAIVQPRASLYGKCHIMLDKSDAERLKKEAKDREEEGEAGEDISDTKVEVEDSDEEPEKAVVEPPVQEVKEGGEETVVVKKRKPVKKKVVKEDDGSM